MVYEILGLIFGIIGTIAALWFFWDKLPLRKRLSWKFAQKAAKKISDELIADNFSPTLIVGIGRGGAIMGALVSGCLGHRSLVMVDRKYTWKKGERFDDMIFPVDIPQNYLEKVLIISGEVHSGNTMKIYYDHFNKLGSRSIRRATLFFEEGATVRVEHKGLISPKKNILMPWMFSEAYTRADRNPPRVPEE